ncbi:MAG: hypothetical protein ACHQIM_16190 [Sphingobacteriales bacterium]
MNRIIPERFALKGLLAILSLFILFHLLIISGAIPFGVVWGGTLKDKSQMLFFETISVIVNILLLSVAAIKAGILKIGVNSMVIQVILWIMFGLFLMNTIGNLFSNNHFEKLVFTPITLILSIFSLRVAMIKYKT